VNTVYAQLIRDVGAAEVADLAHRLGIGSPLSAVPSLALGTSGVTTLEMAAAYATFANDGRHIAPTGIARAEDSTGKVLVDTEDRAGEEAGEQVIDEDVSDDVREALRAVVSYGTGRSVRLSGVNDIAGKTGTTEDHRDAWFVGFSRGYAIAVWVGHASGKPMDRVHGIRVTGSSFPAQIFERVLGALIAQDQKAAERSVSTDTGGNPKTTASPTPEPSIEPSTEPTFSPTPEPTTSPRKCALIFCP
jgi:penicillin-binding protein 1A